MKRVILLFLAIGLISCGSSKTVRTSEKILKGEWVLNTVTYSESGNYNVTLLNDVSKACFEGSTWQFVPNNNTGTYTINNTNCARGKRYFIFKINEIDEATGLYDFVLKPTDEKYKSDTNIGVRFSLSSLSDNYMQWQQTLTVDGKPFTISMNFSKQ
ncbi:lipocalin [Geojedonia litorea]|uniref:Lipocalin n=1 Tax=Geojedonia litorea TaxID=1268269 RepID=A0ABV9N4Q9_9FLAO